jgi:hypothetical protein
MYKIGDIVKLKIIDTSIILSKSIVQIIEVKNGGYRIIDKTGRENYIFNGEIEGIVHNTFTIGEEEYV